MSTVMFAKPSKSADVSGPGKSLILAVMLAFGPTICNAEILWAGDFETGNFLQWPNGSDLGTPYYWGMPTYCRPKRDKLEVNSLVSDYYGDGSCLEIVTDPVRQGKYAAKFTVKNAANGSSTADCDNGVCTRRRTELRMMHGLQDHYSAMPYLGEVWVSVSHFVPSDWNDGGSGFGPLLFQIKSYKGNSYSPTVGIQLESGGWTINHRWSQQPHMDVQDMPWQWGMFYSHKEGGSPYPRGNNWADGLADFPDVEDSYEALSSVNKGGWTDWIFNIKFDARGSKNGGTGFLTLWKREDSGPWVKVLHILPKVVTRGGLTFDHGIGYNSPPTSSSPGGFGALVGAYMDKDQVWNLPRNRVVYIDNVKVGDKFAKFEDMVPEGASINLVPDPESPPNPPMLTTGD